MAGEWIQVDCNIGHKARTEELMDLTGCERWEVVGRMVGFWAWAAMNCEDGVARMTEPRLVRMFGGDAVFWQAVASVGWLEFGHDGQTVLVPDWERRFSKTAKNRACHADRAEAARVRAQKRTDECADAHAPVRESALELGELGELEEVPPPPPRASFAELRKAWNGDRHRPCPGRPWKPLTPPDGAEDRLSEPGWWERVPEALERLHRAKYFDTPATLIQFVLPGFVDRLLGGQYDDPKPKAGGRPDEKPPPKGWSGADEEARVRMLRELEAKRQESLS